MHGYTYEEMILLKGTDFVLEEDKNKFFSFLHEVKNGKRFFAALRHKRRDGSILYVKKTGANFTFKGKPHLLAVVRDVTDKLIAENALIESEDRFRTMADNIPNLAWIANADGWISWYNKRWYEYTGTTPK